MRIKSKLREKDIVIILFLLFFVFQFIQIFRFNFFVQSDDFGYIANAAFFAGYNWNPYTGNMTQYFNIGFPFFASFAFKLFHTLETVYQCLLFVIVVWQTLLMYLVYKMLGRFLDTGKTEAAVIALLYSMGTMAPQNGLYFMSEIPFAFCFILVLYLMLEAGNSEGKRQKMMSALSGLIVAFSYAVHTRFLVLAGTVILVCILYHLAYKKKLIHYLSFFIALLLAFLAVSFWVKYVQGTLYKTDVAGRIIDGNDALARLGYIGAFLGIFTSLNNVKDLIVNIICLAGSYTLLTGGMIWVAVVTAYGKFVEILKKKGDTLKDRSFLVLTSAATISFVGMNILIAINGVTNEYEYKWLTYYRYGRPFVGVFLILALVVLWKKTMSRSQLVLSCVGVFGCLFGIFRFMIPILEGIRYPEVSAVGWMQYYFYNGQSPRRYFGVFATVVAVLFIVMILCIVKQKLHIALGIFLVFSMAMTLSENTFNAKKGYSNYQQVDKTLEFMTEYKDEIDLPIYFLQGSYSGRLRFALYDVKMQYVLDDTVLKDVDLKNAVILTDRDISREVMKKELPEYCVELDLNEYVYTSNIELYERIKK